jgi:hypothetical protein
MSIWDWFNRCCDDFQQARDRERLRMLAYHHEGFAYQETDPERAVALFTQGRNLAERLGEPWWVLFYDVWRVQAIIAYMKDFRNVLDLAVGTALEMRKPAFAGHPWRFAIFNHLLRIYTEIDPRGHAPAIRDALHYLDQEIPAGPSEDRYVMLGRRRKFAMALGNLRRRGPASEERSLRREQGGVAAHAADEAMEVSLAHLALAEGDDNAHRVGWYTVDVTCDLCTLHYRRGDLETTAEFAARAETLARAQRHCQEELAEAGLWLAVLARHAGDEEAARRHLITATSRAKRLASCASREFFDALERFHDLGGDLERALAVRDRQWQAVSGKGRLVYEWEIQAKRCALLARLGRLRAEDLEAARAAARKLRDSETYLAEIDRIAAGSV